MFECAQRCGDEQRRGNGSDKRKIPRVYQSHCHFSFSSRSPREVRLPRRCHDVNKFKSFSAIWKIFYMCHGAMARERDGEEKTRTTRTMEKFKICWLCFHFTLHSSPSVRATIMSWQLTVEKVFRGQLDSKKQRQLSGCSLRRVQSLSWKSEKRNSSSKIELQEKAI